MISFSGVTTYKPKDASEVDHIELRWGSGQTVLNLEALPSNPPAEVPIEAVYKAVKTMTAANDAIDHTQQETISERKKTGSNGQSVMTPQTTSIWGMAALRDATQVIRTAQNGNRNNTLRDQASGIYEIVNGGELDRSIAEQTLTVAALSTGLGEAEIRATLKSASNYIGNKARTVSGANTSISANGNGQQGQVGEIAIPAPLLLSDLLRKEFDPFLFIVPDMIALGHFVIVGGPPKSGKSYTLLKLTKAIDLGGTFLGKEVSRAPVLYLALEDGLRRFKQRIVNIDYRPRNAAIVDRLAYLNGPNGEAGPGLVQLEAYTKQYQVIIIDTFIKAIGPRVNENDNVQVGAILNNVAQLAHETNTAIILNHHTGKANYDDPFYTLRGASSIRGSYDVGIIIQKKKDEKEALLFMESRDLPDMSLTLKQAPGGFGWEVLGSGSEIEKIRAGRATLKAMLDHAEHLDGLTVEQLVEARRVSAQAIQKQLNSLENAGYVYRKVGGDAAMGRIPDLWFVADDYKE